MANPMTCGLHPHPGGRPPLQIDWPTFFRWCHIQCTQEQIAKALLCSVAHLDDCCKEELGVSLSEIWQQKRVAGQIALLESQWQSATAKGNVIAQIWLGKQYLGQSDQLQVGPSQTAIDLVAEYRRIQAQSELPQLPSPTT